MRRMQLFEWEDQAWLPHVFRDFITDHLRHILGGNARNGANVAMAEMIQGAIAQTQSKQIVDLCSGGGGPIISIARILAEDFKYPVEIVLTDLHPNVAAFRQIEQNAHGNIVCRYESTDALNVPSELHGFRTMFTALHHFSPPNAQRIIGDAVQKRTGIAVFEPLHRSVVMAIVVAMISFLRGILVTHRVGPLTPQRFIFTYILPLAPAILAWDGVVSCFRSYTVQELQEMVGSFAESQYAWDVGRVEVQAPLGKRPITYLVGVPQGE